MKNDENTRRAANPCCNDDQHWGHLASHIDKDDSFGLNFLTVIAFTKGRRNETGSAQRDLGKWAELVSAQTTRCYWLCGGRP